MDIQKELIDEFERETESTRKLLNAIPADADFSWKPHDKSMTLGRLASHVGDTAGDWAVHTLTTDLLEWTPDMTPEKWDSHWKFVAGDQTWIDDTKYRVFRTWVVNHMVHHRAQLGVYLRLLGAKIPGMYGPSADEMPAAEPAEVA